MTVLLRCSCGKQLRVPEYATGRRIKCPSCEAIQTVPTADAAPETPPRLREQPVEPGFVRFVCTCGKQMQAREEYAGRYSRCPDCQADVLIPGEPVVEAEEDLEAPARIRADRPTAPAAREREEEPVVRARRRRTADDEDEDEDGDDVVVARPRRRRRVWPWVLAAILLPLIVAGGVAGYLWWRWRIAPDLALVPGDAQIFVSVRVADLWQGDYAQALLAEARKVRPDFPDLAAIVDRELGVAPADVERVTFVVADALQQHYWLIVRTVRPYDRARLLGKLGEHQEQHYGSRTYYTERGRPDDLALYFHDERIFLLGKKTGLEHGLSLLDSPRVRGPLDEALRAASRGHHVVLGVRLPPQLRQAKANLPLEMRAFDSLLETEAVRMIVDSGSLSKKGRLEVVLTFPSKEKADSARITLNVLLGLARTAVGKLKPQELPGVPQQQQAQVLRDLTQLLDEVEVKEHGSELRIEVATPPGDPAQAMVSLKPFVDLLADQLGSRSTENLHKIAQAMQSYQKAKGHLPPPVIYSQGPLRRPLYSWRVELLPFLGEQRLYNEFHLNEPWDSAHNRKLLQRMPRVFQTPGDQAGLLGNPFQPFAAWQGGAAKTPTMTRYQLFFGPRTPFDRNRETRVPDSFPDGPANTILIAESANPAAWTRPEDIQYRDGWPASALLHRRLDGTFLVALADGSVRVLKRTISPQTLQRAVNPADGQPLGKDW